MHVIPHTRYRLPRQSEERETAAKAVQEALLEVDNELPTSMADELRAYVFSETRKVGAIVKAAGIEPD